MAHLPEELIFEILLCLPLKSLPLLRCLSKSLCAIIDNPDFINSRRSKSSQNSNIRKLIFHTWGINFRISDVNLDPQERMLRLEKPISLSSELCGNCNGLIFLHRGNFKFALWNPSTCQFRDISDGPSKKPAKPKFYEIVGSGLGYSKSIDEYKAFVSAFDYKAYERQIWIYRLKSNIWRTVQNVPYLRDVSKGFRGMGYIADGGLHWIYSNKIVAFDVEKETFSSVSQPVNPSIYSDARVDPRLHVLEGSLCVSYLYRLDEFDFYIRKKDEYDQFSWTKLFSVAKRLSHAWYHMKAVGYLKGGDKILFYFGKSFMASYDLKGKKFRKIEVVRGYTPIVYDIDDKYTPILYLESLVSVGGKT